MPMKIESRHFGEVLVLVPDVVKDEHGCFMETYRWDVFMDLRLPNTVVQENLSSSRKGAVRGLHFQCQPAVGKLMRVTRGAAYLVAVDVRPNSPSVGKWVGVEAS